MSHSDPKCGPLNEPLHLEISQFSERTAPMDDKSLSEPMTISVGSSHNAAKRIFDLVFASSALMILIPFLLVIGALVRLDSRGPALFRQDRTGLNGETFIIYKFRTMTVMEDGASARQATVGDVRVSSIGRILRKFSIDELPQLYNVLIGNMSLVGPRPHPPSLDKVFAPKISNYMGRYLAKPGITGLAQVEGARGETSTIEAMERRVNFDLDYVTRASFSLDIAIIFRTVFVLIFRPNAF